MKKIRLNFRCLVIFGFFLFSLGVFSVSGQTPHPAPVPTPTPQIRLIPRPTPENSPLPSPTPEESPEAMPTPENKPPKIPVEKSDAPISEPPPTPETTPPPTSEEIPQFFSEVAAEDLIHFGDEIEIDIAGSTEFDWRGTVDSEGFFSQLPYVDVAIYAVCRTEKEIGNALATAYAKYFRNPVVTVRILDRSKRANATLLGAIKKEQRFSIRRPIRLNELLILSGGITENASGEVTIFRPPGDSCEPRRPNEGINVKSDGKTAPSDGSENLSRERIVKTKSSTEAASPFKTLKLTDLVAGKESANPFIRAGDLVKVEEASPIYVTGAVGAPQKVFFRQKITLTRAIAAAGGLRTGKNPPKIYLYRRNKADKETEIIEVDWTKIKLNPEADILLEANDIIEVMQNARLKNVRPPVVDDLEKPKPINTLPLKIIY